MSPCGWHIAISFLEIAFVCGTSLCINVHVLIHMCVCPPASKIINNYSCEMMNLFIYVVNTESFQLLYMTLVTNTKAHHSTES